MGKTAFFALFFFVLSLAFISPLAIAAPQRSIVKPQALGTYVRSGVVVGGVAGQPFSLLRMQKQKADGGAERLVILFGDQNGQPIKAEPGYFHVNVDEKAARVSVDLAQVQKTAVDPKDLSRMFSGSDLVAATEMTMDPVDLSTNISLSLKQPVEVRMSYEVRKGVKYLVIDLKPTRTAALSQKVKGG